MEHMGYITPLFLPPNLADPVISPRSLGVTVEGVYDWATWNI